jgi:NTE family protein
LAFALAAILAGCATVHNLPGNAPLGEGVTSNDFGREVAGQEDDLLLAPA